MSGEEQYFLLDNTWGSTLKSLNTAIITAILTQGRCKKPLGNIRKDWTTEWGPMTPLCAEAQKPNKAQR